MRPGPKPRPAEKVLSATIGVSVTQDTREQWHAAANARGLLLAEMIRQAVTAFLARK